MESTAVENVVYTGDNGIFLVHTRLREQQYIFIIFQPTCTSCRNMLGGECIGGGEYSSRQRYVHC